MCPPRCSLAGSSFGHPFEEEVEEEEREERVNFQPGPAVPYVATPKSCFAFDSISHGRGVKTFGPNFSDEGFTNRIRNGGGFERIYVFDGIAGRRYRIGIVCMALPLVIKC